MYRISHGTYQPEEQKKRDYSWNIDINKHYFGKAVVRENEMQDLVQPEKLQDKSF